MGWREDLKKILKEEPEHWLAYLHGQQLNSMPKIKKNKLKYSSIILKLIAYYVRFFLNVRFFKIKELSESSRFFVFAGTSNQLRALEGTIESIKCNNDSIVTVFDKDLLKKVGNKNGCACLRFNILDFFRMLSLSILSVSTLLSQLKKTRKASVGWHLPAFFSVYGYLVYFYRVLQEVNPRFVITANDHSVSNRCMLAVAHSLGIKTVYLQHASVSSQFPALRVDYAFLDGSYALDIYRLCEPNQPKLMRDVPFPKVILSGQKKEVSISKVKDVAIVGVAINSLDNHEAVINFINCLVGDKQKVRFRWHPRQSKEDIIKYRAAFECNGDVTLSVPEKESVAEYLSNIKWLVAGNSSIHLEAAISNVLPIYFELSPPEHSDYYGYVKHKLAIHAGSIDDILRFINETYNEHGPDIETIRYYSSTYKTLWDGREGQLVAECLKRISAGEYKLPVELINL